MAKVRKWNDQEIEFLKLNFNSLSYEEIASRLDRPTSAIKSKKGSLKLKKGNQLPVQIGERFNRLTVLAKTNRRGTSGQTYFECKCDCGKTVHVMGTALRHKNTVSCGCYNKERMKEFTRLGVGESSLNNLEHMCKNGAKNRKNGIPYELTTEQFRNLIAQNCYWCGDNPKPYNVYYKTDGIRTQSGAVVEEDWASQQWVFANGVDRLDSNLGYTLNNCVPSCFPCNEMKMDKSQSEFMERMEKIVNFQKQKSS